MKNKAKKICSIQKKITIRNTGVSGDYTLNFFIIKRFGEALYFLEEHFQIHGRFKNRILFSHFISQLQLLVPILSILAD